MWYWHANSYLLAYRRVLLFIFYITGMPVAVVSLIRESCSPWRQRHYSQTVRAVLYYPKDGIFTFEGLVVVATQWHSITASSPYRAKIQRCKPVEQNRHFHAELRSPRLLLTVSPNRSVTLTGLQYPTAPPWLCLSTALHTQTQGLQQPSDLIFRES
jgi:hypothetical protein